MADPDPDPLELKTVASLAELEALGPTLDADHLRRRVLEDGLCAAGLDFTVDGFCHVCGREVEFVVDDRHAPPPDPNGFRRPNWRERLECPSCGLPNRLRSSIHLFELKCAPTPTDRIYLCEQVTPLHSQLAGTYEHLVGSEYLGDEIDSGTVVDGIRHEDLTRLSFADGSVDHVLCFDILEHVPTYERALAEIFRVLRPGGNALVTVPFAGTPHNVVRARVLDDGSIEHLLPPEYHGVYFDPEGGLCFYHFGWELLDAMRATGFAPAVALDYWSRSFGYLGPGQLFWARKPSGSPQRSTSSSAQLDRPVERSRSR